MNKVMVSLEKLVDIAKDFQNRGIKFRFKHKSEQHELEIINEANGMVFSAHCEQEPIAQIKELGNLI